ncbi:MAG: DUF3575 domain-containing protein [Chitinophagales bacterium]
MKQLALVSLLLLLFLGVAAQTKVDTTHFQGFTTPRFAAKDNVIKWSSFSYITGQLLLCGEIRLMYERMLGYNQSITVTASYNYPSPIFLVEALMNTKQSILAQYSIRGGRIALGYRYYPLIEFRAPEGLFIGPYVSYNFVKLKERHGNGDYLTLNNFNANFIVGYQYEMARNWYIEVFTGLGYKNAFVTQYDASKNQTSRSPYYLVRPFRNINLCGQLNIGYAF